MRYVRLWLALARFSLVRELAFRANFAIKVFVEVLWLSILLIFYDTVFSKTSHVENWDRNQFLFFVGAYFALQGILETFFMENCNNFADLVRSGDLDFYLLKPIDEQFLVSFKSIDWSCTANVLMGIGVMITALILGEWSFDAVRLTLFLIAFGCGVLMAYGFLLMLTSGSVWFMRNQSLYELWWLFTTLMRYPREIFHTGWAHAVGLAFSFVIPIMLVSNVPAQVMVQALEPMNVAYLAAWTAVVLWLSRRFFKYALRRYRSASS